MNADTNTNAVAATGPVTLDDVRTAIGDGDANATNAGALRKLLGRGSQTTIQKHLDAIRADLVAPELEAVSAAPDAPKELIQAVWSSAWATAQARSAGALAASQQKTESLTAALATARADAEAAALAVDEMTATLIQQQELTIKQSDENTKLLDAAQTELQAQGHELAALREELKAQAQQAHQTLLAMQQSNALTSARAEAVEATLRGEIDRQISQLADLRAMLGNVNKPAPESESQSETENKNKQKNK
jgi:vacuolar-type H+-ATPase subunit I/STV1